MPRAPRIVAPTAARVSLPATVPLCSARMGPRPLRWSKPLLAIAAACSFLAGCATGPAAPPALQRCLWITRWDWRTPGDVRTAIENAANAGFTTVMFQVRGNGTVLYPSRIEVWSEQYQFQDPGFDPLHTAIETAHGRGVKLLAWLNVTPGWRGADAPKDARQLWAQRPEWFLADASKRRQPQTKAGYVHLNPCLPEVRSYLASLAHEIAERYEVDGIHLDYIRFPSRDPEERGNGYPADPRSFELFRKERGADPKQEPTLYEKWKAACVTQLVREIRRSVLATARRPALSAAVWATPSLARERVCQEWDTWAREGLVDALFPMNYESDDGRFSANVAECMAKRHGVPLVVGVMPGKHKSPTQTNRQIESAYARGAAGVALFGYQSLFGRPGEPASRPQKELRDAIFLGRVPAVRR